MRDLKKCDITYLLRKIDLEMLSHLKIASGSFIYYVINVYVPRVRANAYHVLTTPPRVFRDPKMCLRNIWTALMENCNVFRVYGTSAVHPLNCSTAALPPAVW